MLKAWKQESFEDLADTPVSQLPEMVAAEANATVALTELESANQIVSELRQILFYA